MSLATASGVGQADEGARYAREPHTTPRAKNLPLHRDVRVLVAPALARLHVAGIDPVDIDAFMADRETCATR